MKAVVSILSYNTQVFFRSAKSLVPLAALLVFMAVLYAYLPIEPVGSYTFTMSVLFFIMVWVGLSLTDIENPVSEQLMILKVQSATKYYTANIVFLFLLCGLFALIATCYPLIINAIHGGEAFTYPLGMEDIACAFLLNWFAGFAGCAIGSLVHPRIVPERKLAALIAFAAAVIGIAKPGLHNALPASSFFTWVFPPISDANALIGTGEAYDAGSVGIALLLLAAYGVAISLIKVIVLVKKKF